MLGLLWTFKSNSHAMRVAEGVSARFQCDFLWPAASPGDSIKPDGAHFLHARRQKDCAYQDLLDCCLWCGMLFAADISLLAACRRRRYENEQVFAALMLRPYEAACIQ
jgi:hypothetical protein